MGSPFELNPEMKLAMEPIGDLGECLVIDDFLASADALRSWIRERGNEFVMNENHKFPGPELKIPPELAAPVQSWWKREARKHFKLARAGLKVHARASVVVKQPHELDPAQRLCHQDTPPASGPGGRRLIGGVLYLFDDPRLGGTAFFSKKPGFDYQEMLRVESQEGEEGLKRKYPFFAREPAYLTGDCDYFDFVKAIEPRFNRVIFYPGDIFHSGHICHPELLAKSLGSGRLTVNIFVDAIQV